MGDSPSCEAGGPNATHQGLGNKEAWGDFLATLQEPRACLDLPEEVSAGVRSW